MRTLIRNVRLVPVGNRAGENRANAAADDAVDLEIADGRIAAIRPTTARRTSTRAATSHDEVIDAAGRWATPGLWDQHVHLGQWALGATRLDTSGTTSAAEVLARVRLRLTAAAAAAATATAAPAAATTATATATATATGVLTGFGHRSAAWPDRPTVAALDAVTGENPVVLIAGDAHHGWLNSAALRLFGVPPRDGVLEEGEWYPVFGRLSALPGAEAELAAGYRAVLDRAAAMGVVGVVDLEWGDAFRTWPARVAAGLDSLRIRVGVYPDLLDEAIAAGLRTGAPLRGTRGLVTMGPLKVITDGSLNTRTAYCSHPFTDADPVTDPGAGRGTQNYPPDILVPLIARAHAAGFSAALHAIGDAAIDDVLAAFEATGARGSVEHAQLTRPDQVGRFARLGIAASVQPAHLLDDRDVAERCWSDRTAWCYPFRDFVRAGVELRFGSDAPVSPLDPWLAMAAAVHRSADERGAWHGEHALTVAEALAASTDGRGTLAVGDLADLALLDHDPLATATPAPTTATVQTTAVHLRGMRVAATFVGGRPTHLDL